MNTGKLRLPLLILLSVTLAHAAHADDVRTGEDVLRAMHDRYSKSWYETLTFTQKSTTYNADGTTKVETWHEAVGVPGKLRIDVGAPSEGNGYLMVDGTLTVVKAGKVSGTRPRMNMLLVFGFDVYRQSPEATAKVVKAEGYDLTKVHEETWEGQPVYVVGAEKGDLKSKQFWVEKDRLLFVRLFEPTQADPAKSQDIRFEDYHPLAGGWLAERVEIYAEDKKVFSEEYSDIQGNAKLDPGTFDPKQFNATHWEKP
jgi:outer membrane lipoprotein-sorting protein